LTIQASRFARVCLEESFKYALKRKTFGKTLMEHPVIRAKIGEMARQVECTHAQLENITYQMCTLSKKDAMEKVRHHSHGIPVLRTHSSLVESQLGGPTALLKAQSTKVFEFCAREAAQIFGGASYVRGGQGEKVRVACIACQALLMRSLLQVERLYREVRAYAIPGGSEEIMIDLAVRQAMKDAKLAKL
jgi:alkylation response protein AidB-like acyl-CoA dehydrogenase